MYQNEVYMWSCFDSLSIDVLLMWLFFKVNFFSAKDQSQDLSHAKKVVYTKSYHKSSLFHLVSMDHMACSLPCPVILECTLSILLVAFLGIWIFLSSFKVNFVTWLSYRLFWLFGVLFSSFDTTLSGKSLRLKFMKTPSFGVYIKWLQININYPISWYSGNTLVLWILAIFCLHSLIILTSSFSMF